MCACVYVYVYVYVSVSACNRLHPSSSTPPASSPTAGRRYGVTFVSTQRQLESAQEGYRVARELFNNGRGTATTLIDAEIVLAQTRFDRLNAQADGRIARVRLEHATGRDQK